MKTQIVTFNNFQYEIAAEFNGMANEGEITLTVLGKPLAFSSSHHRLWFDGCPKVLSSNDPSLKDLVPFLEASNIASNRLAEKFKVLRKLQQETMTLQKEISDEVKIYITENRKVEDGEKVEIYDCHDNTFIGNAIVSGAFVIIDARDVLEVKKFSEKPEKILEELDNIYYGVYAIKIDGAKSKQHFSANITNLPTKRSSQSDFYIRKINN